jgi:ABC-type nitrate/sulfonate/bicarbonate transport system substrate-binding protein
MQSTTSPARPRSARRVPWRRPPLRYGAGLACLALLTGAVAACSSGSAAKSGSETSASSTVNLALSGPATATGGPFEIAEYEGYFTKQGLNINVTALNGGPPIVEAEIAGKIDIGEYAPSTSVETYNTSHKLVAVDTEATRSITYAVVSKKYLASKGLTPAQFQALPLKQRIAKLKGASFGTHAAGGLQDHYTEILATYGGLDPKSGLTKINLGNNAADQASFEGGAVNAYWPTAYQDQQELAKGLGVNVFDPTDASVASALSPIELGTGGTGWILSQSWGQAHKATVQKFLKAELQGAQWIKSHTAAQEAQVVGKHFPSVPASAVLANVKATNQTVDYTLVMPAAAVTANLQLAKDSGEIPAGANVASTDVFDPSYLNSLGSGQ